MEMNHFPLGMNNRQPDHALPEGAVRNIVNADVDSSGRVRRRRGATRVYSGIATHSGFSCPAGSYFVDQSRLIRLYSNLSTVAVLTGVNGPLAHYCHTDGVLYLSDGSSNWKIVDGVATGWDFPAAPDGYDSYNGAPSRVDIYGLENTSGPIPCSMIRYYKGRLYLVGEDGEVVYSDPFDFDHYRRSEAYIVVPGITLLEPVDTGIFIADDQMTWFYAGTPETGFDVSKRLDYGAIPGTSVRLSETDVRWQSTRGMIVGNRDGICQNIQEQNVATGGATSGAAAVVERDGLRQYLVSLKNPSASPLAATSWIDAEVIRRGA